MLVNDIGCNSVSIANNVKRDDQGEDLSDNLQEGPIVGPISKRLAA
jgi:hypothetical protein